MLRKTFVTCCIALLAATGTAAAEPVKLKLAWVFGDKEMTYLSGAVPFAKAVNEDPQAKGLIEIGLFPNGALARVPSEQPQLVLDGVADIVLTAPSFSPGRFSDLEALELPGLFRTMQEGTQVYNALVNSGRVKSYDLYVSFMNVASPSHSIHTRFPVNTLADLKGRKIRSTGVTPTNTVRALGAVPVALAASEMVEALGRGTIEGVVTQLTVIYDFQLDRIINNHYSINMGNFLVAMLMNKKKFESLPKQAQDVLLRHGGAPVNERFMKEIDAYYAKLDARVKADSTRRMASLSTADQKTADAAFKTVQDAWEQRRPENVEFLKFVKDELAKFRSGK